MHHVRQSCHDIALKATRMHFHAPYVLQLLLRMHNQLLLWMLHLRQGQSHSSLLTSAALNGL